MAGSLLRRSEHALDPVPARDPSRPLAVDAEVSQEDTLLVAAVLRREAPALETFVARVRCVGRILTALNQQRGRPLDEEQLADLVQDTLVVLWRKLSDFRPVGPFESWCYGIAYLEFRNACRRSAQARMRHRPLLEDAHTSARGEPASGSDDWPDVEEALGRLDDDDSAVIRLRHEAGLSFEAIGERLSIPMNTAKTRYHRGLKRLREWLRVRSSQEEHPR